MDSSEKRDPPYARIVILVSTVFFVFVGTLVWIASSRLPTSNYAMDYDGYRVWLGENEEFEHLTIWAYQYSSGKSPFEIRLSPTGPGIPILELSEDDVSRQESINGRGPGPTGPGSYNVGGNDFSFIDGKLSTAIIVSCEVRKDPSRGFSGLQGTRDHVEAVLGPPASVERIESSQPIIDLGPHY